MRLNRKREGRDDLNRFVMAPMSGAAEQIPRRGRVTGFAESALPLPLR